MKIKTISTTEAIPDMIVGDDIYSNNGQLIIPKGTVLTNRSITRLKFYSIATIKVVIGEESDNITEEQEQPLDQDKPRETNKEPEVPEKLKKVKTATEAVRETPEYKYFNKAVIESSKVLEKSFNTFIDHDEEDQSLAAERLLDQTKETIAASRNPLHTFHMLQSMRDHDDATFVHSLNVSIICNAFGKWLEMSKEDIDALTLAGLLHDIGKVNVPEFIIKKPGSLTAVEYTTIKLHARRGYNILNPLSIDPRIKNAALMHHERLDGSGYPSGLKGDEIDEFAKIVSIADIYDAMTSARVYRGPLCPFDVISIFESEGYIRFDPHYQLIFLQNVVDSYINDTVRLSNGQVGEIVMINKLKLSKPVVKIGDEFLDLSSAGGITIEAIL